MKFKIELTDRDGFRDSIQEAARRSVKHIEGLLPLEESMILSSRSEFLMNFVAKWIDEGTLILEGDTEEDTLKVLILGE